MVSLRQVLTKKDLKIFIYLPRQLYGRDPLWVPPIFADEGKFHSPKQNLAAQNADTQCWLAYNNNVPVGRIMGIINHTHNRLQGTRDVRFYQLDCVNDPSVSHLLIEAVRVWGRKKGMNKLVGPFGFSDKDPQGVKIEGFEHLAVIQTPSHPPYLRELIEQEGMVKEVDCLSYQMHIPDTFPEAYLRVCDRVNARKKFFLKEFNTRKALRPYILPVLRLLNETYTGIYGFVPLSDEEINSLAKQYLPILDPRLVKLVVDRNNEPAAFVVSMPGLSEALQKCRGQLFPFGFLHILQALKTSRQLVLLLGAVKPNYRGQGVTALLAASLLKTAKSLGMTVIDTHLILENNYPMRAEAENLGGKVYKRFRVYQQKL